MVKSLLLKLNTLLSQSKTKDRPRLIQQVGYGTPMNHLPILMNLGFSNCPSVSSQQGVTKAIRTNRNANPAKDVARRPVLDFELMFVFVLRKQMHHNPQCTTADS